MRTPTQKTRSDPFIVLGALALYVLRLDHVAGLIGDDAWYVVLAKAIAQGAGPRLISAAGPHVLSPVYPPGFPAILSLVFLIRADFPGNVPLLKIVSIAAMLGVGLLTYRYAVRYRGFSRPIAAAVAFGTVITPALVFLATSTLMSEDVFLFVELLSVLAIERAAATDARATRWAVLAGALAAASVLIRTAGIAVVAAGAIYLVGVRRWRAAVLFCAVSVLCVAPWSIYARTHAATRAQLVDHGGVMAIDYASWFWTSEAGAVGAKPVGIGALPARLGRNLADVAIRDMGGLFMPLLFRTSGESGLEVVGLGPPEAGRVPSMGAARGTQVISFILTALVVAGFVAACRRLTVAEPLVVLTLVMIGLWPFWAFRFVLPLTPFLFGYLVVGVETVTAAAQRWSRQPALAPMSAVRIVLLVVIGLNVLDHVRYIAQAYGHDRGVPWKTDADDISKVLDWIRTHGDRDGAVAADNPALVYLGTGRQTIGIASFGDPWDRWHRMGVRYLVSVTGAEPINDRRWAPRFKVPQKTLWVFELIDSP